VIRLLEYLYSSKQKKYTSIILFCLLPFTVLLSSSGYATEKDATTLRLGGCGGVYFYAPAGELWVEVEKQDLNIRRNKTHLRALLFAPDRSVVVASFSVAYPEELNSTVNGSKQNNIIEVYFFCLEE
jgi:hypothetical protein